MNNSNTNLMETFNNHGYTLWTMEPGDRIVAAREAGERIRAARERKGWSQTDLGKRVGITQVAIQKIETGETQQSKHLPRLAMLLGLDLGEIDPSLSRPDPVSDSMTRSQVLADRADLPIYAAAEGGPGEIIRSSDPIDWYPRPQPLAHARDAYGLYVVGDSMVPEYRPRDIALVNPHLPIIGDEVYIFYTEREGEARATIKHLRRASPDKWLILQHNPSKNFELLRREWQLAHRVIGKYSRQ